MLVLWLQLGEGEEEKELRPEALLPLAPHQVRPPRTPLLLPLEPTHPACLPAACWLAGWLVPYASWYFRGLIR